MYYNKKLYVHLTVVWIRWFWRKRQNQRMPVCQTPRVDASELKKKKKKKKV